MCGGKALRAVLGVALAPRRTSKVVPFTLYCILGMAARDAAADAATRKAECCRGRRERRSLDAPRAVGSVTDAHHCHTFPSPFSTALLPLGRSDGLRCARATLAKKIRSASLTLARVRAEGGA